METKPDSSEDEVMCHCTGTTRDKVKRLFEQGMDVQAISDWTGALTGCGGCEWEIGDFLKELAAQRASGTTSNK
ncbi:MAG: (2Fe-2S)-binding protein [Gallionella sp.]